MAQRDTSPLNAPRGPSHRVWDKLRAVAKPDSRLHFDFAHMHPDFEGSDAATTRILDGLGGRPPRLAFLVPDGALVSARERLLRRGCRLIVSTFCMRRGFRLLDPERVKPSDHAFAATLDGLERFGEPLSVAALADLGPIDLVLTGAAAVSDKGVRFGRSYQYFDIEWGLLTDIGAAGEQTQIGVVVHDVQVTIDRLAPMPREAVPDFIATPTRLIRLPHRPRRPVGIDWQAIDADEIEMMPSLIELQRAHGLRA